ncbi:MAG: hypothetical protein ACREPE_15295 [Lysobacter sp.]
MFSSIVCKTTHAPCPAHIRAALRRPLRRFVATSMTVRAIDFRVARCGYLSRSLQRPGSVSTDSSDVFSRVENRTERIALLRAGVGCRHRTALSERI